ncbi:MULTISPECIES: tram-like protein [unclassified Campylobacter]|uniref:tram-like protein n=1 Tax=unclassified Campylobacter TaxID=2593542 RepID=UPI001CC2199E|nr:MULTISPECIES: tram-like protein [unclassified Campylobacter]
MLNFTNMNYIDLKAFTKKKTIFCALNSNAFCMSYEGKNRFLQKDGLALLSLQEELYKTFNLKQKLRYFFIKNALCSKAKTILEEKGFICSYVI